MPPTIAAIAKVRHPVEWHDGHLELIDQTALPGELRIHKVTTVDGVIDSIRRLVVRGAPAIGICGAYGIALGIKPGSPGGPGGVTVGSPGATEAACAAATRAARAIEAARPTAVNLSWAVSRTLAAALTGTNPGDVYDKAVAEAATIEREDREASERIGEYGRSELAGITSVLTHCNAGRLVSAGWGTALGIIYAKHEAGEPIEVFASETRPLLQGARLTAWELSQANIPVTLVADAASASLVASGRVGAVVVGCDRVARNGDTANKIGTLTHAVMASRYGIPFYVVGPLSSFDPSAGTGADIVIEERPESEILSLGGASTAPHVPAWNPAFDITPGELITAFITDAGVIRPPFPEAIAAVLG